MGLLSKRVRRICDAICDCIVASAFEARRQTSECWRCKLVGGGGGWIAEFRVEDSPARAES